MRSTHTPYPLCEQPDQLGCILGWNTATPAEVATKDRETWGDGTTRAVNPLTFTTAKGYVPASENPESLWYHFGDDEMQSFEHLTGAQLVRDSAGGWVVQVDFEGDRFLSAEQMAGEDAYNLGYTHLNDVALFVGSLRANAITRLGL